MAINNGGVFGTAYAASTQVNTTPANFTITEGVEVEATVVWKADNTLEIYEGDVLRHSIPGPTGGLAVGMTNTFHIGSIDGVGNFSGESIKRVALAPGEQTPKAMRRVGA